MTTSSVSSGNSSDVSSEQASLEIDKHASKTYEGDVIARVVIEKYKSLP